jgi:TRAP transporter 4TM/12TM fusion protein
VPAREEIVDAPRIPETEAFADAAEGTVVAHDTEERPARQLSGRFALAFSAVAAGVSLYALYQVFNPVPVLEYRMGFLAVVLPLTFLAYRPRVRVDRGPGPHNDNPGPTDWLLAAVSLTVCAYPLIAFEPFLRRDFAPTTVDLVMGGLCVLLVLEATRRTVGPILPAICLGFVAYAYYGGYIPLDWEIGHRGYNIDRIVAHLYMGTEGLFGVPLDVAASYIILFSIYGAVLEYSGAGQFFVDISFAAFRRSASAPGRTVTLAGFLLGTVSGSGTATAVSLGSVAWPILRRAGYSREQGGGVLAAAGIGAILSPPTLGAAAFIIAEYLNVSYLRVLIFATVPTLLYYLGIILAIEIDARRSGAHATTTAASTAASTAATTANAPSAWRLLGRYGYHFSSLVAIVVLMAYGISPFRAVVYATILAFALSFPDPAHRLGPRRAVRALAAGTSGVLPVAATTAAAGIIVGVVTLTGLGLKASSLIVAVAGGSLTATAVVAAVAVLLLGLAVPVTASFIIAAVIISPALQNLGVVPEATYMFIFYFAVLSEVTPPTALAAVASAAVTGGNAFKTMMMTWKYTLPAFLVPFAFVLAPNGRALLGLEGLGATVAATAVSAAAVAALAVVTGGWMFGRAHWPERALCSLAAVLLLFLQPVTVITGGALVAVAAGIHLAQRRLRPSGKGR